jgi:tetratricopeptide (TPR) repeat protein
LGNNKKNIEVKSDQEKKLSTTKLVYLVVFLLFAGMIMLYSSDTFNSLPKGGAVSNINSNNPHAGADLSKLEEIKNLEQVLEKNPEDHQSLLKLGHLYNDSGFKQRAIDAYTKYLKVHPKDADVIVDMSVCYFDLNNNEKALELLDQAISINPDHQIAHFNKGIVYFTSGNIEAAKKSWQKAIEIDPTSEVGRKAEELSKSH